MYGIVHIRSVSVGLDSQIWYLFIYITGYLNVRKISETMYFRTFVGPLQEMKTYASIIYYFFITLFFSGLLQANYFLLGVNYAVSQAQ